jgi:hypothetical protein
MADTVTSQNIELSSWDILYSLPFEMKLQSQDRSLNGLRSVRKIAVVVEGFMNPMLPTAHAHNIMATAATRWIGLSRAALNKLIPRVTDRQLQDLQVFAQFSLRNNP